MRHRYILLLILAIFFTAKVFGQVPAPSRGESQNRVLQDMSQRTGQTISINSLSSQQWYFGTYDYVRNLGCPIAPQSPTTSGNWQRFEFTYNAFTYVYLISDNLEVMILCNESALPTAIPATQVPSTASAVATSLPPPTIAGSGQTGGGFAQATATIQGLGQTGGGFIATSIPCPLAPRLQVGSNGRVTPGDANWLHSEPSRSASKIGEIPAETIFSVVAGPSCDEATGMNYWQIFFNQQFAWTSEGLNGEYWLEPYIIGIVPENINTIQVSSWASAFATSDWISAMSPDSQLIIFGDENGTLRLFRMGNGIEVGAIGSQTAITSLRFSDNSLRIFIGNAGGEVIILETGALQSSAILPHEARIRVAIANASVTTLVVADDAKILTFWDLNALDAPLRRIELPEVAGNLEFSGDNRFLIVRDLDDHFLTALTVPNP